MKTLKVSPVNRHPVWQSRLANQHASQPGKPLGSAYLDGLHPYGDLRQAQVSAAGAGGAVARSAEKEDLVRRKY